MEGLERFLKAQEKDYEMALSEIQSGRKRGHWMWYIFPQIKGLGTSTTAMFYEIKDINEAKAYLQNPILRKHLIEISEALLLLDEDDITKIMMYPDNLKLQSCMTLFSTIDSTCRTFQMVLDKFYDGYPDEKTLEILKQMNNN